MDSKAPIELTNAFDKKGNQVINAQPLGEVLDRIKDEYLNTGESSIAVPVVHVYLFRPLRPGEEPKIILQQRSDNHKFDKTVGGHVSADLNADKTVEKETSEEMGVKVRVIESLAQTAFSGAGSEGAVATHVEHDPWQVSGRHDRSGVYHEKPTVADLYIGFYDGSLESLDTDGEATEFAEVSVSELRRSMEEEPDRYTPDLHAQLEKVLKLLPTAIG